MYELNVYKMQEDKIVLKSVIIDYLDFNYVFKLYDLNTFSLKVTPFSMNSGANEDFFLEMFENDFDIKNNCYFIELESDKRQVGIITEVEQSYGEGFEFVFKGLGLECLLQNTINNPINGIYNINGTINNAVQQVINDFIAGEKAVNGGVDGNKAQPSINSVLNIDETVPNPNSSTYSSKLITPYEQIQNIITLNKQYGLYYKVFGVIEGDKIQYTLKQGIDKSGEVKFNNLVSGNLKDLKITSTNTEEYNAYTVGDDGEGSTRNFINKSNSTKKGLLFKELFVSANDEDGNLADKGEEALEDSKTGEEISATLRNIIPYNLFVGDSIEISAQIKLKKYYYQRVFIAPIVEHGYSYTGQEVEEDIKAGDLLPIVPNVIRNEQKNNKKTSRR